MKVLGERQIKRLNGKELVAFNTGLAYAKVMIKRTSLWKKIKFFISIL